MQRTTDAAREAISRELARYLATPPGPRTYDQRLHTMCSKYQVLELVRDMGGALCLSPCGRVAGFSHDARWPTAPTTTASALWQRAAARAAATRYPALEPLAPRRLAGDVLCARCQGAGELGARRARCDACDAIGWIWPEVQDAVPCPYCAFIRDDEPPVTEWLERCFCRGVRRIERARVERGFPRRHRIAKEPSTAARRERRSRLPIARRRTNAGSSTPIPTARIRCVETPHGTATTTRRRRSEPSPLRSCSSTSPARRCLLRPGTQARG